MPIIYTPEEFKHNLDILSSAPINPTHQSWYDAIAYFDIMVQKHVDISDAVPFLMKSYDTCHNMSILHDMGNSLVTHFVHHNDLDAIVEAIKHKQHSNYFIKPLISNQKAGADISIILPQICLQIKKHKTIVTEVLIVYIKLVPTLEDTRMREVVNLFMKYKSIKANLPAFLSIAHKNGIQISTYIPLLIQLLPEPKQKTEASRELYDLLLEPGVNVNLTDELIPYLSSIEISANIAASLATIYIHNNQFTDLEKLISDSDIKLKQGALISICNFARKDMKMPAMLDYLTDYLISPEEILYKQALETHLYISNTYANAMLSEANIHKILHHISLYPQKNYLVNLMVLNMQNYMDTAKHVNHWFRDKKTVYQTEILPLAAHQIVNKLAPLECSICSQLPNVTYFYYTSHITKEVKQLLPPIDFEKVQSGTKLRCPECEHEYTFSNKVVQDEMMGTYNEIVLERVLFTTPKKDSSQRQIAENKKQMDEKLLMYKAYSNIYLKYLQEDSVRFQLDYYQNINQMHLICMLFLELNTTGKIILMKLLNFRYKNYLDEQLYITLMHYMSSTDLNLVPEELKRSIVYQTTVYQSYTKQYNLIAKNLKSKEEYVKISIVRAMGLAEANPWGDNSPFFNTMMEFSRSDKGPLADYSQYIVLKQIEKNPYKFDIEENIRYWIQSENTYQVSFTIELLIAMASNNHILKWTIAHLGTFLHNENLHDKATDCLTLLMDKNTDISSALPYIIDFMPTKTDWILLNIMQLIEKAVNKGYDMSSLMKKWYKWLYSSDEGQRTLAVHIFWILYQRGIDITPFEMKLVQAIRLKHDTNNERILIMSTDILLKLKKYSLINIYMTSLILERRKTVIDHLSNYKNKKDVEFRFLVKSIMENMDSNDKALKDSAAKVLAQYL